MHRTIQRLERDAGGAWLARLDCGHVRHVTQRGEHPGRQGEREGDEAIGSRIECAACGERRWPEHARPYKRTGEFDAISVPAGLLARHTTKRGVWARIHVLAGRLRYRIHEPFELEEIIEPGCPGVVLPEVPHEVEPIGDVRFFVEFHRVP